MNAFKSFSSLNPLWGLVVFLLSIIIFLIFYLMNKVRLLSLLKRNISHLNQAIEELDDQAKLIIKSDLDSKLLQEEAEDKLNKLVLLKDLILASIYVLDEGQLFSHINEKTINDLGFRKGLILSFDDLEVKVNIGFEHEQIDAIKKFFEIKKEVLKTTPLLLPDSKNYERLLAFLRPGETLIAPIKASECVYALFVVSNLFAAPEIERSVKEAFLIICMYLGQRLDSIKAFENLYHTKDDLEKKVKERTNELLRSLKEIEAVSKTKSDFISSVSHELRTPLTSVKGFSSLLVGEKFGKLPPEAKKRLEKIDENVNRLVNMVNTLLDISRIESGKMEVKIAPADIVRSIKEVGDFLAPQMQDKKITFTSLLPKESIVYMDKSLIEQVLTNIINNAIKFTPSGGKITVSCRESNQRNIISVSDTGCGMEKDDSEKIFQEFFRVSNPQNRQIRGSGLGLSLVKKIIDTHEEKVWMESKPGYGSTFYFTLKLAKC